MRHKLLLADDSVTIQRVIELTFADEDVEVVAVGDGLRAIQRAQSDRPDIVLADVNMPERDGYEVASFIKRTPELAHIPVLLLTGAFEPIDDARARAVGCDGVLVKPFEPQLVISRVKELISGKRSAFEAPAIPGSAAVAAGSSDDYFDRLGTLAEELAGWNPAPEEATPPPPAVEPSFLKPGAPPAPPHAEPARTEPIPEPVEAPRTSSTMRTGPTLAEAFVALLAAEQGKVSMAPMPPTPALDDEIIERIAQRVVERLKSELD